MQHVRIPGRLQEPDKRVSLCRVQHSQWALPVGARWQRVPVDEGQASLDETLVTVHTQKLLLQLCRRVQVQSPTCNQCPKGKESVVLSISRVFNIIHNKVITKGFMQV